MGNCLASNNKVLAEDDEQVKNANKINKKRVRLRLQEERSEIGGGNFGGNNNIKNGESKSNGAVRIKLVVTQEELKQILSYKNGGSKFSLVEQLLSEMKLRRSVLEVGNIDRTVNESWSPVLESIPEDH
ncbi:hypothetical protein TIFTF001_027249 [Ficus carica]|uniref:Uncharacterized protein n=1 Tax=Ficus carica TaxID=3494 RepID=A0AA88DMR6_FICCA|nr:hypothetical protein TIFTF001_027249 [Ficus carica]